MKSRYIRSVLVAFLAMAFLLTTPTASAWGPAGHRIVAELAQRQLTPAARAALERLLKPDNERSLADVATWADDLRNDPGQKGLWKASSPLHYINFRGKTCAYVPRRDCPDGRCVIGALDKYVAILGDRRRPDAERRQALRFVVHFIGDIHQPLHAGYRDDKGGNAIQVRMDGKGINLHKVWDSGLLGTRNLPWKAYAQRLADDDPVTLPSPAPPLNNVYAQWAEESCRITRDDGIYPNKREITLAYIKANLPVAERRLREAGLRLGNVVNSALAQG
jgi:S1/P1 Nuclease